MNKKYIRSMLKEESDPVQVKLVDTTKKVFEHTFKNVKGGMEINSEVLPDGIGVIDLYSKYYDLAFLVVFNWIDGIVVIQDHSFSHTPEYSADLKTDSKSFDASKYPELFKDKKYDISNPKGVVSFDIGDVKSLTFDPFTSNNVAQRIKIGLLKIFQTHFKTLKAYKDFLSGKDVKSDRLGIERVRDDAGDRPGINRAEFLAATAGIDPVTMSIRTKYVPQSARDLAVNLDISREDFTMKMIPTLAKAIKAMDQAGVKVTKEELVAPGARGRKPWIDKRTDWQLYKFLVAVPEDILNTMINTLRDKMVKEN